MPELPDVTVYVEALSARIIGRRLEKTLIRGPFLLRSVTPPLESLTGRIVQQVRRVGKRIAVGFEGDLWLVFHLMIAGRLHWFSPDARKTGRAALAYFVFDTGTLTLTEAGSKRRASLYVFGSSRELAQHDPGGLELLEAPYEEFRERLLAENHTLKRSLTDPRTFSGIGNAYSDEILHRARLSPVKLTARMTEEEIARLHAATLATLNDWIERLRIQTGAGFPEKVTAFRPEMAVHGRYGKPCPDCGAPVQRIRYADNECNYCAVCQNGGRLLADRALSRLLGEDWPRTLAELEERIPRAPAG